MSRSPWFLALAVVPAVLLTAACAGAPGTRATAKATVREGPCAPPIYNPPCEPVVVCPPTPCPAPAAEQPLLPPEAQPGEVWCYIRVPAVTQTVNENVLVAAATCREEWVPPVTQEVTENVCTKPEERRQVAVPAEFADRSEQVLVCDTKTEWRRVDCQPKSMNQGEQVGECWTLVQLPPQYTTRTTRVCVKPEGCREEVVPAAYEAKVRTVTVREGYNKKIEVPAVYETVTREVEVSPARWEWRRETDCETPGMPIAPDAAPTEAPAPALPPAPATETAPAPAPAPAQPAQPAPGSPSYETPPAGALPPADLPPPPSGK
jgi:hypothetical protein